MDLHAGMPQMFIEHGRKDHIVPWQKSQGSTDLFEANKSVLLYCSFSQFSAGKREKP
jgi:hypothetical protein